VLEPRRDSCAVRPDRCVVMHGKTGDPALRRRNSVECSTFEGNGSTDAELRSCARDMDLQAAPRVTVDGRAVQVHEAETTLLQIVLPADNVFGLSAGTQGLSVAHGWVASLNPLTPGTHEIVITTDSQTITTTIAVIPGT
jgi:hypothetical protein